MASLSLVRKDKSSEKYNLPKFGDLNNNEVVGRLISFVGCIESADDVFVTARIDGDYSFLSEEQSELLRSTLKEELFWIGIELQ